MILIIHYNLKRYIGSTTRAEHALREVVVDLAIDLASRSTHAAKRWKEAKNCTTACTAIKCNGPRLVQPCISIVCEVHCIAAACEHMRRSCRPCCMVRELFMCACMLSCSRGRGLTLDTKRDQRAQRARRRGALPPTSLQRGCGSCSQRRAEGKAAA